MNGTLVDGAGFLLGVVLVLVLVIKFEFETCFESDRLKTVGDCGAVIGADGGSYW